MRCIALAVLLAVAAVVYAHPHPEYEEVPWKGANPERPTHRIVAGSGNWTYVYDPTRLVFPAGVEVLNGHGLAKDPEGNIYFTYQSPSVTPDTRALLRFDPNGFNGVTLGKDNFLANGTPHGLRINDDVGGPVLYHANNNVLVHKTDLDGNVLWSTDMTKEWTNTPYWPFKPTDSIAPPNSPILYVSDGYGSSFVHGFDVKTGVYMNLTFGGSGNSVDPQRFNCPHGIDIDIRRPGLLLVSDRGNNRLQYVTENGTHVETINMAPGSPLAPAGVQPCNVDTQGEYALVPGLDGPVGILDANMTIVTVLEVSTLLGAKCPHPHDAIFLENGDIVVCCWNPGFLSYWKKQ